MRDLMPSYRIRTWRDWLRSNLFYSRWGALQSLAAVAIGGLILWWLFDWAIADAGWALDNDGRCNGGGACWPYVLKYGFYLLFGLYPQEQIWRALLALLILSASPFALVRMPAGLRIRFVVWILVICLVAWLLVVGLGREELDTTLISGLLLTLLLASAAIAFGLPLGLLFALLRRSTLPVVKVLAIGLGWIFRGVPSYVLLFAALSAPLLLPHAWDVAGVTPQVLVLLAYIGLASARYADNLFDGLASISATQLDVAASLGLRPWHTLRLITIPQALLRQIPALVESTVWTITETTIISLVAGMELVGIGRLVRMTILEAPGASVILGAAGIFYLLVGLGVRGYGKSLARRAAVRIAIRPITGRQESDNIAIASS